jgi:membrane-associated phospholipid phosphatase
VTAGVATDTVDAEAVELDEMAVPRSWDAFWARLDRVDDAVEALFAPLRAHRGVEKAAIVVSNLADYGFAWAVIAALKARRRGPNRRRTVQALATAGVSSYLVNAGLKRLFDRRRPEGSADSANGARPRDALPVRLPTSSSFPSGHTLAATCTAVMLADGPAETAAFLAFATAVAASRIQLGDHHGSDVLGGAVIGLGLGVAGRWLRSECRRGAAR